MTNVISFKPKKNPEQDNPYRGRWTNHFDEEFAHCFGTHAEWNDIQAIYLMEQLMNYMEGSDECGSIFSMLALSIAIKSYKQERSEIAIREFLAGLKHIEKWNYDEAEGNAGETTEALRELCNILYEKYPDL